MPNPLVRDQWEYLMKWSNIIILIKPGQPIGMTLATFRSFSNFPDLVKEPVCQKWDGDPEYYGWKKPK